MFGHARLVRQHRRPITRTLVGVAIAVGFGLIGAAPAVADPSPYNTLSCSCQETAPAGSEARTDEIQRGIAGGILGSPPRGTQDAAAS